MALKKKRTRKPTKTSVETTRKTHLQTQKTMLKWEVE